MIFDLVKKIKETIRDDRDESNIEFVLDSQESSILVEEWFKTIIKESFIAGEEIGRKGIHNSFDNFDDWYKSKKGDLI